MRTSSQFALASHIMLMLAAYPDIKFTSEMLSGSTGANPVIIRTIFAKLNQAGLLQTKSGRGKTTLTKPANEISLWAIFLAVETGDCFKMHANPCEKCVVGRNIGQILTPYFALTERAIEQALSAVKLSDLVVDLQKNHMRDDVERLWN